MFVCVSVCVCVQRAGQSDQFKMGVKCYSSKTVKATDFKYVFRGTVRTRPPKFIQKGAWSWSRNPINFWALNANSSKTVKAIRTSNLTACFQGPSGHDPLNIFFERGCCRSSLGGDMHSHERLKVSIVFSLLGDVPTSAI